MFDIVRLLAIFARVLELNKRFLIKTKQHTVARVYNKFDSGKHKNHET